MCLCVTPSIPSGADTRSPRMWNLNTSHQAGTHWVAYYKNGKKMIYFDSFRQITPMKIQRYIKTKAEYELVQPTNTHVCGHLCLIVLTSVMREHRILKMWWINWIMDIHTVIGKLPGLESYNAVDTISIRHDICYRDNDIKEGKTQMWWHVARIGWATAMWNSRKDR